MKVYYAHHIYKYNTKIEEYELNLIKKNFNGLFIINPNTDIEHENYSDSRLIMEKCLGVIENEAVVGVVFSSMSGVVGKGVFDEVSLAKKLNKKIWYIINNDIVQFNGSFSIINEHDRIYAIVE